MNGTYIRRSRTACLIDPASTLSDSNTPFHHHFAATAQSSVSSPAQSNTNPSSHQPHPPCHHTRTRAPYPPPFSSHRKSPSRGSGSWSCGRGSASKGKGLGRIAGRAGRLAEDFVPRDGETGSGCVPGLECHRACGTVGEREELRRRHVAACAHQMGGRGEGGGRREIPTSIGSAAARKHDDGVVRGSTRVDIHTGLGLQDPSCPPFLRGVGGGYSRECSRAAWYRLRYCVRPA